MSIENNQLNVIKYHNSESTMPAFGHKGRFAASQNTPYSLIDEEISLPAAVIKRSALKSNIDWMQSFANHHQVKLSPHGKTTMTPAFFSKQLEAGAWGITVATPAQAEVAALAGAKNIIMANQLIGKANMAIVAQLIRDYDVEFYCCVDSLINLDALDEYFANETKPLNVFIEFGVPGGRCGVRSAEELMELADSTLGMAGIKLAGIEVYEGVIGGDNAEEKIRAFLAHSLELVQKLKCVGLIEGQPIVSGAGSAWYDVVAESFANLTHTLAIIRPGCYAIHDTGIYLEAQSKVMQRAQANQGYACELGGDLNSSLEVWAYVISRPEEDKVIIGLGKRDVAFDAGLPIPEHAYRNGEAISVEGLTSIDVMDQHTFMKVDPSSDIQVGDMIAFSTSHPCLTFDKWRYVAICNDEYQVEEWVETRF